MKLSRTQIARAFVATPVSRSDLDMKDLIPGLAQLLVEQKMTGQVDLLLRDIAREQEKQLGVTQVSATTARAISDQLKKQIAATSKDMCNAKDVVLSSSVDESLLGGVVLQTADEVVDMSVKAKLKALRS